MTVMIFFFALTFPVALCTRVDQIAINKEVASDTIDLNFGKVENAERVARTQGEVEVLQTCHFDGKDNKNFITITWKCLSVKGTYSSWAKCIRKHLIPWGEQVYTDEVLWNVLVYDEDSELGIDAHYTGFTILGVKDVRIFLSMVELDD